MYDRGLPSKLVFRSDDPLSRSRTHQSFGKDANINVIMAKYKKTGVLVDPLLVSSDRQPRFGDFSDLSDYGVRYARIKQAQEDFMTLPAVVRAKFNNDVENCLTFISNPENLKEAVALKLLPSGILINCS